MAGRGPAPKTQRRNASDKPIRGEYQAASSTGWSDGPVPDPPDGLTAASRDAWTTWFGAWWAAHWTRDDLPSLRTVIMLYDEVERGRFTRVGELRQMMDTYGITPKGQQDRRWTKPKPAEPTPTVSTTDGADPYARLRAVG